MGNWDYTQLAATYSLRPPYSDRAIDRIRARFRNHRPRVADIGAGTGHLTLALAQRGCQVDAVEPNDAMRSIGQQRASGYPLVTWSCGTGENSGLSADQYHIVAFGSSFNTTDRALALREAARLLHRGGIIACLWNHRQLGDRLQAEIEELIRSHIPGYSYGSRREDQAPVIAASGLFTSIEKIEEPFRYRMAADDWIAAWRSHATLQRNAGPLFEELVDQIEAIVRRQCSTYLELPYSTVGWTAVVCREAS